METSKITAIHPLSKSKSKSYPEEEGGNLDHLKDPKDTLMVASVPALIHQSNLEDKNRMYQLNTQ